MFSDLSCMASWQRQLKERGSFDISSSLLLVPNLINRFYLLNYGGTYIFFGIVKKYELIRPIL